MNTFSMDEKRGKEAEMKEKRPTWITGPKGVGASCGGGEGQITAGSRQGKL